VAQEQKQMADQLAEVAMRCAVSGATEYLGRHNLQADPGALTECLRSWVLLKLPEALSDADVALRAGMVQAAESTFVASLVLAGVEAAKEAGRPRTVGAGQ